MSAVLLGTAEPHSDEWHQLRAGGIGGSEIAAVMGLSRWTSPFQLWHRKRGNLPPQPTSTAMEWGNRLEPVIVKWFEDTHPQPVNATPGIYQHAERVWQRCSPDGLVLYGGVGEEPALLEIKTSRFGEGFTKDEVPVDYACQVQWNLDVMGLQRAHVVVLIGGNEPREYVIDAEPSDQAALREAGERFWASLQDGDEPPLDCSDHTYQAVRELNPDIDRDGMVDLPPEAWGEYVSAKAATDEAEAAMTLIKSRILQYMGDARIARFAEIPVLRRQAASNGTPYLREVA